MKAKEMILEILKDEVILAELLNDKEQCPCDIGLKDYCNMYDCNECWKKSINDECEENQIKF
jgi:hypothetical protein